MPGVDVVALLMILFLSFFLTFVLIGKWARNHAK